MSTVDVLNGWDLLASDAEVSRLNMSDWRSVSRAIERVYQSTPPQVLNGSHLGLTGGTRIAEGSATLSRLSIPVVISEVVWLPDPVFSLLVPKAAQGWRLLPESGSRFYGNGPGAQSKWQGLWDLPKEGA